MTSHAQAPSVPQGAPDGAAPDALIRLFRDGRPRTRAEVIDATGHARSTVAPRLAQLTQLGFLRTDRGTRSTGGRRPIAFVFNPDARAILALELGPSHCRVVVGNLGPTVLAERYERLDATRDPGVVLAEVEAMARELLRSRPLPPLVGIGVSLPTPLDARSRRPLRPPLMPSWDGYDVQGRLKAIAPVPVVVDRDNYLRALGEFTLDPAGNRDMIYVHASTLALGRRGHRGSPRPGRHRVGRPPRSCHRTMDRE